MPSSPSLVSTPTPPAALARACPGTKAREGSPSARAARVLTPHVCPRVLPTRRPWHSATPPTPSTPPSTSRGPSSSVSARATGAGAGAGRSVQRQSNAITYIWCLPTRIHHGILAYRFTTPAIARAFGGWRGGAWPASLHRKCMGGGGLAARRARAGEVTRGRRRSGERPCSVPASLYVEVTRGGDSWRQASRTAPTSL